ncbi:hypothetical protein S83_011799 [Arachis hypogaea]
MADHRIHSTINLDTPLKDQHHEDEHETNVTPTHEDVPPGYKNQEVPNPDARNAGARHFAWLGDDYYHAMQEMRHQVQELERHRLELER